jgi:single-strand DNA-binding protein
MFIATFTGNLGRDPETRSTSGGDVCSFSVAVKQGFGRDAKSEWFRCSVWGKRGETITRYLRKGMKVTVVGEMTIGEYQGKPQYDVRVVDVDWPFEAQGGQQERRETTQEGGPSGDLDDSVPW